MKTPDLSARAWLMVGLAGVLLRLFLWWFTIGTSDATEGFRLSPILYTRGVLQTYYDEPIVNQPPPICIYAGYAWHWSGGDLMGFARLIKLWALAGEALSLWALWRFAGPKAFAGYACLPASILVSGFHCNIDPLYAALLLLSALAFDRKRYFLSGLLMAVACNVKLLPALFAPLLLISAPNRKAFVGLTAALAIGILPFVPLTIAAAPAISRNVIAYNSAPEHWGILLLLKRMYVIPVVNHVAMLLWESFRAAGRYVVVAAVLACGFLSRLRLHLGMTEQLAIAGALFLVLAPGFGVQYVVLIAPSLCLINLRWGLLWGWISGVFIASVYCIFMVQWWPAQAVFTSAFPFPTWILGLIAWATLVLFIWRSLSAALARGNPPPEAEPLAMQAAAG